MPWLGSDSLMGEHGVHKNKNDTQSMDSFAFSAPEISLPKYGKAARGMGENFTVNLVIGARSVGGLI